MLKVDKTLVFTSWVVVEPAEDIEGLWVSHALDYDVISQGDSPAKAVESVTEAVAMAISDDLVAGLDPKERRAPGEFYDRLATVLKNGIQVKISEVSRPVVLATQASWVFEVGRVVDDHKPAPQPFEVNTPVAFEMRAA